jgi:hypothetical protein
MADSTNALYALQEIDIAAELEQSAEFNKIRARLNQCWGDVTVLLQECYTVTSTVSPMESETSTTYAQRVSFMNDLVAICKQCHDKAQVLANQHSIPIERYKTFETTLHLLALPTSKDGRNQSHAENEVARYEAMPTFTSAYENLQGKVDDMVVFFGDQVQTCNLYLEAVQGRNTRVTLDQARQFAMEWTRVRPIIIAAKVKVSRVCEAITMSPPCVNGRNDQEHATTDRYPRGTIGSPSATVKCENMLTISE